MPSTVLNIGDIVVNKTGKAYYPHRAFIVMGETYPKKIGK